MRRISEIPNSKTNVVEKF